MKFIKVIENNSKKFYFRYVNLIYAIIGSMNIVVKIIIILKFITLPIL